MAGIPGMLTIDSGRLVFIMARAFSALGGLDE
jgi:hypothetical protein